MEKNSIAVRAAELPNCPFCNGEVFYHSWLTHKIFQMECKNCKSHWRTGINNNPERDVFVELVTSKNPDVSSEYFNKKVSIEYWQKLIDD